MNVKLIAMARAAVATTALLVTGLLVPLGTAQVAAAASFPPVNHEQSATAGNLQGTNATRLEIRNNTNRYGGTGTTFKILDADGNSKATLAPDQSYAMTGRYTLDNDVHTYITVDDQRKMAVIANDHICSQPIIRCIWHKGEEHTALDEHTNKTYADDNGSWWMCRTRDTENLNLVIELWRIPTETYSS